MANATMPVTIHVLADVIIRALMALCWRLEVLNDVVEVARASCA